MIDLFVLITLSCMMSSEGAVQKEVSEVQQSHIEANVPEVSSFDQNLRRDLALHFGEPPQQIKYELLRDLPTQVGVATPKFYVWVEVSDGNIAVQRGAARLAAVEKERFSVLQFVTAQEIQTKPSMLMNIFPAALVPKIVERASAQ